MVMDGMEYWFIQHFFVSEMDNTLSQLTNLDFSRLIGAPLKPCSVRKNMLATDAKVCLLSTSFNKQAISSSQIKIQTNNQLMLSVGGLEHGFYFSIYFGNVIIPTDELIFFRGVGIPPTSSPWIIVRGPKTIAKLRCSRIQMMFLPSRSPIHHPGFLQPIL